MAIRAKSARTAATAANENRKPYWIGTLDDCPKQNVELAGQGFPKQTGIVMPVPGVKNRFEVSGMKPGAIARLSDIEISRIKDALDLRGVRWNQVREIKDIDSKGQEVVQTYRQGRIVSYAPVHEDAPQPVKLTTDVPLAKYVYMVSMEGTPKGFAPQYGIEMPKSLWDEMEKSGENAKRAAAMEAAEKADDAAKEAKARNIAVAARIETKG